MTLAVNNIPGVYQPANLPQGLPKTQSAWQQFLTAISTWRPGPPAWNALTLENGWEAYGSPFASPQYQVDHESRLWCRGVMKAGTVTNGIQVATLPFAPDYELAAVGLGYSGSAYAPMRLDVTTGGAVLLYGASAFAGSYFVSLDNLSFSLSP